jgi:hypothetical protein
MYWIKRCWQLLFAHLELHRHNLLKSTRYENGFKRFYRIGPVVYWPVITCRWFTIGEFRFDNRKEM